MITVDPEDVRRVTAGLQAARQHLTDDTLFRMQELMASAGSQRAIDESAYLEAARAVVGALAGLTDQPDCAGLLLDLTRITSAVRDILDDAGITAKLAYLVAEDPSSSNPCNSALVADMFYWHHRWAVFDLLESGNIQECVDYLLSKMHLFAKLDYYPFHSILAPAASFYPQEALRVLHGLARRESLPTEARSIVARVMSAKFPNA
jgi:hypothetical protein